MVSPLNCFKLPSAYEAGGLSSSEWFSSIVPSLIVPFTRGEFWITLSLPLLTTNLRRPGSKSRRKYKAGRSLRREWEGKMKRGEAQRRRARLSDNAKVRTEMETFLEALASYADYAAREPKATFEEYHVSLMAPTSGAGSRPTAKAAAQGR